MPGTAFVTLGFTIPMECNWDSKTAKMGLFDKDGVHGSDFLRVMSTCFSVIFIDSKVNEKGKRLEFSGEKRW